MWATSWPLLGSITVGAEELYDRRPIVVLQPLMQPSALDSLSMSLPTALHVVELEECLLCLTAANALRTVRFDSLEP